MTTRCTSRNARKRNRDRRQRDVRTGAVRTCVNWYVNWRRTFFVGRKKNPDAVPIYRIEELATFGRNGLKYVFDKSPVLCVSLILDFGDLKICQQFSKKP